MDIQLDLGGDESPLSMKADFLLSLCELVVGGKDGLQPIEKTVIDRCVRQVYRELALGLGTANPRCSKTSMKSCSVSRSRRPSGWRRPWSSTAPAPQPL